MSSTSLNAFTPNIYLPIEEIGGEDNALNIEFREAFTETLVKEIDSKERCCKIECDVDHPDRIVWSSSQPQLSYTIRALCAPIISCVDYPESTAVPAKFSIGFFKAVQLAQTRHPELYIPTNSFKQTLEQLIKKNHLSQNEAKNLSAAIRTKQIFGKYLDYYYTREGKNIQTALSLAFYYRNYADTCWHWIREAEGRLKKGEHLSQFINIRECLQANTSLPLSVFMTRTEEITEIAAKCENITTLHFSFPFHSTLDITTRIGAFLKRAQFITNVDLNVEWSGAKFEKLLSAEMSAPIAQALKTNTSIQTFKIAELQKNAVLAVLKAIKANPKSRIRILDLTKCEWASDRVAKTLLDLLKKNRNITRVGIHFHWTVSDSIKQEIEKILESRQQQLLQPVVQAKPNCNIC